LGTKVRLVSLLALPGTGAFTGTRKGTPMDLLHLPCAGLDVSKRDAKVCVRIARQGRAGADSTVTTWSSMTGQILALREHLIEAQVTAVILEATGDYWKPHN